MFHQSIDYKKKYFKYKTKYINQKILQKGGGQVTYVSDLSGSADKKKQRLVYLLQTNINDPIKFVIKITPKEFDDVNEINIYKELSSVLKETQFKNNIIKYYGDGDFPVLQDRNKQEDFQINFDVPGVPDKIISINYSDIGLWDDVIKYQSYHKGNEFQYLIIEYDDDFRTLKNSLSRVPNSQKCSLFENLAKMLLYLNKLIGFSHWDLHSGNILVDTNDPVNFKLFDFDHSSTNKNFSNAGFRIFVRIFFGKDVDKNEAGKQNTPEFEFRLKYGFLYDLEIATDLKLANSGCILQHNLLETIMNYINYDNNITILKKGQKMYTNNYNSLINSLPGNNDKLLQQWSNE